MLFLKQFSWVDWTLIAAWVIIFVITIIVELETMNLVSIWFSIGALAALICGILFAKPYLQIIIFFVTAVIAIVLTRPLTKKITNRAIIRTNVDRYIGKIGVVTKEINPFEIGEVKVENTYWRAINKDNESIKVGVFVIVDGIEGIKFIVSKVDNNTEIEII
ncbi:MAG: NfeD family protein [Bacilli bacterium]|nr:NfeD family protein [Bacilli bacterium]MDD4077306.1 NfeD family protein [Bacilli bacterium]